MTDQPQKQQPNPHNPTPQISQQPQQQQNCCVLVRDLDSGVYSCIDPQIIHDLQQLPSSRKTSAWQDYWQERQNIKSQLLKYVNSCCVDKLRILFDGKCKEIDINQFVYMDGWSLLHHAVTRKNCQIVIMLLGYGIDINSFTQSMKRTALHLAVLQKTQDIIKQLLVHGANPNAIDSDFCTPLHYAAELGYLDIMEIFLNNCQFLDISLKNVKKMTVMGCCHDIRIRNMIREYCFKHGIQEEVNLYQGGQLRDPETNQIYLARTRSDVIDKILNHTNNPHTFNHANSSQESEYVSIVKNKKMYPGLGTKINRQKLEKMQGFAKRSLESFKESCQSVLVESMQNYEMIRQLGSGNFGTVFLIRKKKSSKLFALKRLSKKLVIENKMKKYAYAEREILKNIKHPFILHASSFFQDPIYLYMVMDFCAGGDLEKQVRKAKFSEQKARKYCCQIVLALQQLHRRNYLFRDLKVSNVLLDELGHAKLADFGLAKQTQMSHSFLGSVCYLAPQMLVETDNKPHTACMDWYLLGVFVYEMLVGLPPFFNQNRGVMFDQIKRQKPRIPSSLTPQCKDFLIKTLSKKPHERLGYHGSQQIKNHPWFKQQNWTTILQKKLTMQPPQINQKELRTKEYIEQEQIIQQSTSQMNSFRGWDYYQGQKS